MLFLKKPEYRRQFTDLFPHLYPEYNALLNPEDTNDDSVESLYKEKTEQSLTKNITFVVTEACNLACTYCYECNKDHNKFLSIENAKKAIDIILSDSHLSGYINSNNNKCVIIEFIGGEPFLAVDVMDFVCDYFKIKTYELDHPWKNNYMFNITTNGVLWRDPKVQRFLEKHGSRTSITITIDGDKELHDACRIFPDGRGSHDIVIDAVKDAIARFNMKDTKVTFAPENIQYISRSIPYLISLGLTNINANPVYENVWKKEDSKVFYKELIKLADYFLENEVYKYALCNIFEEHIGTPMEETDNGNWCGGDGRMLAIGTDGTLYPCIRFMKYSLQNKNREEFVIGHIEKGIDKLEDNKYLQQLACITRRSQSTDECFYCSVAKGCSWCTGYNYDYFGTPNQRATFICYMHKARVLANYYYWNKLYKKENLDRYFPLYLSKEDIEYIADGDEKWKSV